MYFSYNMINIQECKMLPKFVNITTNAINQNSYGIHMDGL